MTRIEAARHRAAGAKRIPAAAAVAGFLVTVLVVRSRHVGHTASSSGASSTQAQTSVS
jgi:hypothetical protein